MMHFTEQNLNDIRDMIAEVFPAWDDVTIERRDAPFPSQMPEVLGLSLAEGLLVALERGTDALKRDVAFHIWEALPDKPYIRSCRGFHVLCDALDGE